MLEINGEVAARYIESFIRGYVSPPIKGVVIGLSGGIDSTVTFYLCVRALKSDRILALILPDSEVTPHKDIEDAIFIAEKFNVKYHVIDINPIVKAFSKLLPNFDFGERVACGNLRARIRMCILYYYANLENRIVVGTGDKSELLIGYFTKYGDGGVDILPLGDLYKTQVRMLGRFLNVPEKIVRKPSSPQLWKGHLAEEELGLSYEVLDPILYLLVEEKLSEVEVSRRLNVSVDLVLRVKSMISGSVHKRRLPPIAYLPREAFAYQ